MATIALRQGTTSTPSRQLRGKTVLAGTHDASLFAVRLGCCTLQPTPLFLQQHSAYRFARVQHTGRRGRKQVRPEHVHGPMNQGLGAFIRALADIGMALAETERACAVLIQIPLHFVPYRPENHHEKHSRCRRHSA